MRCAVRVWWRVGVAMKVRAVEGVFLKPMEGLKGAVRVANGVGITVVDGRNIEPQIALEIGLGVFIVVLCCFTIQPQPLSRPVAARKARVRART